MQQTPTDRSRRRAPIVPIGVIVAILALILIGYLISSGGGGAGGGGY